MKNRPAILLAVAASLFVFCTSNFEKAEKYFAEGRFDSAYCSESNTSLHLAIFVKILSTGALHMKTRGFWL